jgi:hypothetical protein
MELFEASEEITLFTVDMRSQASVDLAKDLENRGEIGPVNRVGQIGKATIDGFVIVPQRLSHVHEALLASRAYHVRAGCHSASCQSLGMG